jgi:hypothetical protein
LGSIPRGASGPLYTQVMKTNQSHGPDDLAALQLKRVQQEIEKLEVETRLLKRGWYFQPHYIAAILPILAVVATGFIAYSNSDFKRDAEAARSEVAKLKPEAETLRQQVAILRQEESSLKPERDRLAAEVHMLQPKATALQKQISTFSNHISMWRLQLVEINARLKSVTPPIAGSGVGIFPPPTAEPERKRLQEVIDSMLATLNSK